jgi:hypothetical protein
MEIVLRLSSKPTRRPGPRSRPQAGLRLALLSIAAAILLLGAVITGVFCYESTGHGPTATAGMVPAIGTAAMSPCPAGTAHDS